MNILRLENVYKSFQLGNETINVLEDITLEIAEGTITIITGESGSGKSTLLNIIGGIDTPDTGHIIYKDNDISRYNENRMAVYRRDAIGFIFQFHFLLKDFTALENIMMPAIIKGNTRAAARERAMALLEDVGLENRREHYLVNLSGGERQRIAVARSLMNDPPILVADEPTGNLDQKNTGIVEEILFGLVRKYNKTLLLVTHDTELAGKGDRQLYLEYGMLKTSEH